MAISKTARRLIQPANRPHGVFYEGLVATRCGFNENTVGWTNKNSRSGHVATADIYGLKIAWANFRIGSSDSSEVGTGSAMTLTASVEYPTGVFEQITFNGGAPSGTVADAGMLFSDYTRGFIPRGATFQIRLFQVSTTNILYSGFTDAGKGDLGHSGNGLTDLTMGGSISNDGSYTTVPTMIIGRTKGASVGILGSSVARGYNDTSTISDYRKGLVAKSFPADTLAFVNLSNDGADAVTWQSVTASRKLLYPYFSHVIFELCSVPLNANGKTSAQTIALMQTLYQLFPPKVKITQTTCLPKTTSSDSWATTGNQTLNGNNTERTTFNDALRAGGIAWLNNGYYEISDPAESSHNSGKWTVDGSANKYTADGIHPQPAGYSLIASSGNVDAARLHYP